MHINRLHLQNFQSIRDRVVIELAPITLLYGPNSAGKSAAGHAFRFITELLQGKVDSSRGREWIHGRSPRARMRLGLGAISYDATGAVHSLANPNPHLGVASDSLVPTFPDTIEENILAYVFEGIQLDVVVEITRDGSGGLSLLETSIDGVMVARADWFRKRPRVQVHWAHPALSKLPDRHDLKGLVEEIATNTNSDFPVKMSATHVEIIGLYSPIVSVAITDTVVSAELDEVLDGAHLVFAKIIKSLLVTPSRLLGDSASQSVHLGPLRRRLSASELTHLPLNPKASSRWTSVPNDQSQWSDGTRAWRLLAENPLLPFWPKGEPTTLEALVGLEPRTPSTPFWAIEKATTITLVDLVNSWIASVQRLDMGYRIVRRELTLRASPCHGATQVPPDYWLPGQRIAQLFLEDLTLKLPVTLDSVGTGVGQVVPVLVTVARGGRWNFIEQPELHLHPRLQSVLADFFISQRNISVAAPNSPRFGLVIESHSEHIVLRILRRIRETSRSQIRNRETSLGPEDVAFYYFDRCDGHTEVKRLRVDSRGRFVDRWPRGFFDDRSEDLFDVDD